jgi:beta-galactosidase
LEKLEFNYIVSVLSEDNSELIGENAVKAKAGIATIILKTSNLNKTKNNIKF